MKPTCPKCDAPVETLTVTTLNGKGRSIIHLCVTLSCPACGAVLGAQMLPPTAAGIPARAG